MELGTETIYIRSHCFECQHSPSFEDLKLIGAARNDIQLLIKESILIARDLPLPNRQVKSFQLELF